jgi:hypothetical protein
METAAQHEQVRMQTEQNNSAVTQKECVDAVAANPMYAVIASKIHISSTDQNFPLETLNDTALPTREEIKKIYLIYGDIQQCRQITLDAATKTHPLLVLSYVQMFSALDRLWADFARGKMSWGKFNEGRKAIYEENKARLVQVSMQISGQLQNQHQSEIEQRQRAAQAFSQWVVPQQALAIQQQAVDAANRPRIINCNYFGNTASCSSN